MTTLYIIILFFIAGWSSGYLTGEKYRRYQVGALRERLEVEQIKARAIRAFYERSEKS